MSQPAAKRDDKVVATDTHIVLISPPTPPAPTPLPHPFAGPLDGSLSSNVNIESKPAAVQGSTATNKPAHVPQGGSFQKPPHNRGTVQLGSRTVYINGKPAARNGDKAITCNDPTDLLVGTIVAVSTVLIGG
jgi:uncharacterized Zn-binding protein involved in type VI secretion